MKIIKIVVLLFSFSMTASGAEINIHIECDSKGTSLTGEKTSGVFKEKFVFEEKAMDGKSAKKVWKISKREFFSNGKEYMNIGADHTNEYLLFQTSSTVGSGFNRKLNVFTFYIDLKSLELERIVTSIPKAEEERTHGICKQVK